MRFEDIAAELNDSIGHTSQVVVSDEPVVVAVNFLGGLISTVDNYPWRIASFQNIPGDPLVEYNFIRLVVFDFPKDRIPTTVKGNNRNVSVSHNEDKEVANFVFAFDVNAVFSESLSEFLNSVNNVTQRLFGRCENVNNT